MNESPRPIETGANRCFQARHGLIRSLRSGSENIGEGWLVRLIKIGLGNINATVGAIDSNVDRLIDQARSMAAEQVTIATFPEQVIGGYPPEDLVQWDAFVENQWSALLRYANATADFPMVSVLGVAIAHHGLRYNCAAVVAGGEVIGLSPKEKLPTYAIFYEGRTFAFGSASIADEHKGVPFGDQIYEFDFGIMSTEVCEDLWSPEGPSKRRAYAGSELVVNISGSPYRIGIVQTRRELVATRAADYQVTHVYTNLVGANDGLIFDGGGYVCQNGKMMHTAPRFTEGYSTSVVDLNRTGRLRSENTTWRVDQAAYADLFALPRVIEIPAEIVDTHDGRATLTYPTPDHRSFFLPAPGEPRAYREELFEDILDALAMGIGDYFEKVGAWKLIGVSLSGGRDSLLTLLIAHRYASRATGGHPESILRAFHQPSRFSSRETREGAVQICRDLGVPLEILSIDDAFEQEMAAARTLVGGELTELTKQNIQARIRAQRMWNWSNSAAGLFLQTGNMTEKSVGYTTIGGDLMGALGVLANVPKTVVMALLDYLYEQHRYEGIKKVLAKPAGPELAPNQVGEDELMPFPILDACFYLYAGEKLDPDEIRLVLGSMFPEVRRRNTRLLCRAVRPTLHAEHLQMGPGPAFAAHRQPRSRARARPATPGRFTKRLDEKRVLSAECYSKSDSCSTGLVFRASLNRVLGVIFGKKASNSAVVANASRKRAAVSNNRRRRPRRILIARIVLHETQRTVVSFVDLDALSESPAIRIRLEQRLQPRLLIQGTSIDHRPLADLAGIDGFLLDSFRQFEIAIAHLISLIEHEIAGCILDEPEKAALHATASQCASLERQRS